MTVWFFLTLTVVLSAIVYKLSLNDEASGLFKSCMITLLTVSSIITGAELITSKMTNRLIEKGYARYTVDPKTGETRLVPTKGNEKAFYLIFPKYEKKDVQPTQDKAK